MRVKFPLRPFFKVKINPETLEDLASALHAFEDPDSELLGLDQGSLEFKEELEAYRQYYQNLSQLRKKGLKNAVVWVLTQQIEDEENVEGFVPDLYRRIWIYEPNIGSTEKIIEELETIRYTKAIRYILDQAKYL